MNQSIAIAVVIAIMVVTANIPFVSERVFGMVGYRRQGKPAIKPFWLRFFEVLVLYGILVAIGFAFEGQLGNRFVQTWEFYAITLSIYLVCAYPGFVWRYLMRLHGRRRRTH